ncbi:DUF3052 domain-containing protein [Bogoriella caseilytica]|uniref:DUF3052 domain-containing protein n=1 Tax=Bogoriella caseilytica TaxID=56055 RepID=UPI001FE7E419|nr:DUF3052 domain-containing protein [Bogoriella caseilytica]
MNTTSRQAAAEGKHVTGSAGASSGSSGPGPRFGFTSGLVIQEFYYDDDVDAGVRAAVEEETGTELVDEDFGDVCDGAIIWWRADDGGQEDLTDLLVDAQANLDDGGLIWVLTPKPGLDNHVAPADVEEAAKVAGMLATSAMSVGENWNGIRVAARSRSRR